MPGRFTGGLVRHSMGLKMVQSPSRGKELLSHKKILAKKSVAASGQNARVGSLERIDDSTGTEAAGHLS